MSVNICKSVTALIGNTPMVELMRVTGPDDAQVFVKLESFNPGGSIKDRICLAMIEDAEKKGLLADGSTIIEPTSGNTGIGLAMISAAKGYKCVLVMPETMSIERRQVLAAYGAQIVLTPGVEGMSGAVRKAGALAKKSLKSYMPGQFNNPVNPNAHRLTTGPEILRAVDGRLDILVAGVGTGGTITGTGEFLKKEIPDIRVVAVEPKNSAVLSGGNPGPHKIQGIGAGFVPQVLNRNIIDDVVQVSDDDAFQTTRLLAKTEGIFAGISGGAAVWAALKLAGGAGKANRIVAIIPDGGERYLSMEECFKKQG